MAVPKLSSVKSRGGTQYVRPKMRMEGLKTLLLHSRR